MFSMLGALMCVCDMVMNLIPNVHLGGMFIMVFTVVYRWMALLPIYVYVFLIGFLDMGFGPWWIPYLYVWTVLWGMTMLLPRRMPKRVAAVVYAAVCGLHGFAFGFLWIPSQVVLMNFTWEHALLWWSAGFLPADVPHGIGNLCASTLTIPLITLLSRLNRTAGIGKKKR